MGLLLELYRSVLALGLMLGSQGFPYARPIQPQVSEQLNGRNKGPPSDPQSMFSD